MALKIFLLRRRADAVVFGTSLNVTAFVKALQGVPRSVRNRAHWARAPRMTNY